VQIKRRRESETQFSKLNKRGPYGRVMFALLLTNLVLFTIQVAPGWAPTDQASAPRGTEYSSLARAYRWLITVETDRSYYHVGDTVYIGEKLTYSGLPQARAGVSISVKPLNSNASYYVSAATTDEEGKYKSSFTLGTNAEQGEYLVTASALQCASQTRFRVVSGIYNTIYVKANGQVEPTYAPISRNGDVYTLTSNVTANSTNGIVIERNNVILDGAGFTLNGKMLDNSNGIYLTGISSVTVRNMSIRSFHNGIYENGCFNGHIVEVNLSFNNYGIYLQSSNFNTISGNNIAENTLAGILLANSQSNNISKDGKANSITSNGIGGIKLEDLSNNNNIVGNYFASNTYWTIYIESSSYNHIFHNSIFLNNGVYSDSPNSWDDCYSSGGNYWNNYYCLDYFRGPYQNETGSDGIGDTPYIISSRNVDRYPLVYPYTSPALEISPKSIEKTDPDIGTYFNVSITIKNVRDLFGFDTNITWDNALITCHACYCTDALNAVWGSGSWQLIESQSGAGWYKIAAASTKNSFTEESGTQVLFKVEFHVEDPHVTGVKETPIHFGTHMLSDSQAGPIQHSTADAQYKITTIVYTLTISTVGSGFVDLNATGVYHYGDVVQLTAVPATGWSFRSWGGDLTGSASPATLLMTCDFSVTANFAFPRLYIDPSLVNRTNQDVGRYFNVSVKIEGITDLFGFDLNVTWDNTLMTLSRSCYDDSLDSLWGAGDWYVAVDKAGAGWCKLVAVSTMDSFNTTGEQTMFILEFRVEDPHTSTPKQTPIHFYSQKLSDSQYSAIAHTTEDGIYGIAWGRAELTMSPTSKQSRMYGETFTVGISMSDAFDVKDFEFEIHYNTTLLDYVDITWNALGSGTIDVDEAGGNITGSTSGTPISGRQILITVEFKAACYHVWKSAPGWANDLTDMIFFQWANLSFPSGPDLRYERGGLDQINVGPDFAYTFSPIQGDVNNDGTVGIFDLRTVGAYYLVRQGDPNWTEASTYDLCGDGIVDIFDLTTAAASFGYMYIP